jgi:hypothetical protein
MNASTVSNIKKNDPIDHNNLFLQKLAHDRANSQGTKGFVSYAKFNEDKAINEIWFQESVNTTVEQYRSASQQPLTQSHFANQKNIQMFSMRDSFKDSKS